MGGNGGKRGETGGGMGGNAGVWDARARLFATVTSLTTDMIATQAFGRRCIQSEEAFCRLVYHTQFVLAHGGGSTPLKQKETWALCVPSAILCCLLERTRFQTETERSTSQEVWRMARMDRAMRYIVGRHTAMPSHDYSTSNCGVQGATETPSW